MKYISAKEVAEKWNITERRVEFFCSTGKISEAKRVGNQWIIPSDAERPADGRTKAGKELKKKGNYHFPLLIYASPLQKADDFSREEKQLLCAQTLYLEGNYVDCLQICAQLLLSAESENVKFGAVITSAHAAIVLGLHTEYRKMVSRAEEYVAKVTERSEDYRLALEIVKFHISWDAHMLWSIDISKLSAEGARYYQCQMIMRSFISNIKETSNAILLYETVCMRAQQEQCLVTAMTLHFVIAGMLRGSGMQQKSEAHLREACAIGLENHWCGQMAKFYYISPALIKSLLEQRSRSIAKDVLELSNKNVQSWKVICACESKRKYWENIDLDDMELVHLVGYGLTTKEISTVLNETPAKINGGIARVCSVLNIKNKKQLKTYIIEHVYSV